MRDALRTLLAGLILVAVNSAADEAELWGLLAAQDAAIGQFEQELLDEEGELLERSSGSYAVLRPGYFRWEIEDPDRQLLLVSGDTLWHYDLDLETATRRSTGGDSTFAPLELLGGDPQALRERFRVTVLGAQHYRLEPTYANAGFAAVELRWDGDRLRAMHVIDRSGQRLLLDLVPTQSPAALTPADFDFTVPEGVEVFYDDGV
jgi:outer membrane lipoprotein carrier protein